MASPPIVRSLAKCDEPGRSWLCTERGECHQIRRQSNGRCEPDDDTVADHATTNPVLEVSRNGRDARFHALCIATDKE